MSPGPLSRKLYLASLLVGGCLLVLSLAVVGRVPVVSGAIVASRVWVTDDAGNIVHRSGTEPLPYRWSELDKPGALFEPTLSRQSTVMSRFFMMRISTDPPRILIVEPRIPKRIVRLYVALFLMLAVIGVNAVYAAMLTAYARRRGREVKAVVSRLKSGDLRARFRIGRLDEIGRSMQSFNEMADEIERLVQRVQSAEAQRSQLLRELAHDVRTPLTGLSYLVESVSEEGADLEPAEIARKMGRANQELQYFKRLIEDLFLLAETEETRRGAKVEGVALDTLVAKAIVELDDARVRIEIDDASIDGEPFLLERLVRNAVGNALRFARTRVTVRVRRDGDHVAFECEDDGPGLSDEAQASFGRRRTARFLDMSDSGKPSLGLGSVIMKRVAEIHGGRLTIENWFLPDGGVGGARLRAVFPARLSYREAA